MPLDVVRFAEHLLFPLLISPGCSQLALDSISELAGRYLRHLGRTFRLLLDRNDPSIDPEVSSPACRRQYPNSTFSLQEMVRLAIRENGNLTPETLSSHITEDIFKQNQRVEDSLSKVRQAMAAQVIEMVMSLLRSTDS
jgi:hypothetical protein